MTAHPFGFRIVVRAIVMTSLPFPDLWSTRSCFSCQIISQLSLQTASKPASLTPGGTTTLRSGTAAADCSNKRAIWRFRMRLLVADQARTTLNEAQSATLQARG